MNLKNIFYIEILCWILAVLGFTLKIGANFGSILLVIGLLSLVFLYLAIPFLNQKEKIQGISIVVEYAANLTLGIGTLGILFKLNFWQSGNDILKIALYSFLCVILVLLFSLRLAINQTIYNFYQKLLIQNLLIASISFLFFLTPHKRLAQLYFKNDTKLIQEIEKKLDPTKREKKNEIKK
jgi:hypothetical protein